MSSWKAPLRILYALRASRWWSSQHLCVFLCPCVQLTVTAQWPVPDHLVIPVEIKIGTHDSSCAATVVTSSDTCWDAVSELHHGKWQCVHTPRSNHRRARFEGTCNVSSGVYLDSTVAPSSLGPSSSSSTYCLYLRVTRTATHSCLDPEMRMSFLLAALFRYIY